MLKAASHVPEAIASLVYWANKRDKQCAGASVKAAEILLDRGLGKVPQAIAGWDADNGEAKELVIRFARPDELMPITIEHERLEHENDPVPPAEPK